MVQLLWVKDLNIEQRIKEIGMQNIGDATRKGRLDAIISSQQEEIAALKLQLKLAGRDKLTKLPGREELIGATQKALINGQMPTSLIFMDLNGFKKINDTMGHAAGNMLLIQFAAFLKRQKKLAGENGRLITLARLHGDEFAILLPYFSIENTRVFVDGLKKALKNEIFLFEDCPFSLHSAMGIASTNTSGYLTAEKLLHEADLAMYEDKKLMKTLGEKTGGFPTTGE